MLQLACPDVFNCLSIAVFAELVRIDFDGPLSIHCEFHVSEDDFMAAAAREAAFFLGMRERVGESGN